MFLVHWQGPFTAVEWVRPHELSTATAGKCKCTVLYHINVLKWWIEPIWSSTLASNSATEPSCDLIQWGKDLMPTQKSWAGPVCECGSWTLNWEITVPMPLPIWTMSLYFQVVRGSSTQPKTGIGQTAESRINSKLWKWHLGLFGVQYLGYRTQHAEATWAKSGGHLIISVPNEETYAIKLANYYWRFVSSFFSLAAPPFLTSWKRVLQRRCAEIIRKKLCSVDLKPTSPAPSKVR